MLAGWGFAGCFGYYLFWVCWRVWYLVWLCHSAPGLSGWALGCCLVGIFVGGLGVFWVVLVNLVVTRLVLGV